MELGAQCTGGTASRVGGERALWQETRVLGLGREPFRDALHFCCGFGSTRARSMKPPKLGCLKRIKCSLIAFAPVGSTHESVGAAAPAALKFNNARTRTFSADGGINRKKKKIGLPIEESYCSTRAPLSTLLAGSRHERAVAQGPAGPTAYKTGPFTDHQGKVIR